MCSAGTLEWSRKSPFNPPSVCLSAFSSRDSRGFARGVSRTVSPRFFLLLKMKRQKTEKNGRKRKEMGRNGKEKDKIKNRKKKKKSQNGRKREKKKEAKAAPFRRPLLQNPETGKIANRNQLSQAQVSSAHKSFNSNQGFGKYPKAWHPRTLMKHSHQ